MLRFLQWRWFQASVESPCTPPEMDSEEFVAGGSVAWSEPPASLSPHPGRIKQVRHRVRSRVS